MVKPDNILSVLQLRTEKKVAASCVRPVGFAFFGRDGDTALVSKDGVGHHQQRTGRVFSFDLLPSPGRLGRGAQESSQTSGFHVVHTRTAGQPRDDVHRGGTAQAVVTAGGRSGRGQGL